MKFIVHTLIGWFNPICKIIIWFFILYYLCLLLYIFISLSTAPQICSMVFASFELILFDVILILLCCCLNSVCWGVDAVNIVWCRARNLWQLSFGKWEATVVLSSQSCQETSGGRWISADDTWPGQGCHDFTYKNGESFFSTCLFQSWTVLQCLEQLHW